MFRSILKIAGLALTALSISTTTASAADPLHTWEQTSIANIEIYGGVYHEGWSMGHSYNGQTIQTGNGRYDWLGGWNSLNDGIIPINSVDSFQFAASDFTRFNLYTFDVWGYDRFTLYSPQDSTVGFTNIRSVTLVGLEDSTMITVTPTFWGTNCAAGVNCNVSFDFYGSDLANASHDFMRIVGFQAYDPNAQISIGEMWLAQAAAPYAPVYELPTTPPVPEPSTYMMLAIGLGILGFTKYKKSAKIM